MFTRKGTGGRVLYGYRKVADIRSWEYVPEENRNAAPSGAGVVNVVLEDIQELWWRFGEKYDLEVVGPNNRVARWSDAEMISESCFIVTTAPK